MKIDEVEMIGGPLVLATQADVDALEAKLWIRFPEGYPEYVTRLGEGVLGGTMVRIYPPWRIEKELSPWRARIKKYWFWDDGKELLPKERALECVVLGDTVNGDELIFHPGRPDRLFVLPRDSENVFDAGRDVLEAVEWICASGQLVEPFAERQFEPFDSRELGEPSGSGEGRATDPEGEALDDLIELGRQWAERHAARQLSQQGLVRAIGAGKTGKLLYEATVFEGALPYEAGYLAVYSVIGPTGNAAGVYRYQFTGDSSSSQFDPKGSC